MSQFQSPTMYKLIKVYKIQRSDKSQNKGQSYTILNMTVKQKIDKIYQKLINWMKWSSVERVQIQENFMLFPNQSIYNEGIRVSATSQIQHYNFQLIKKKWEVGLSNCFCYQYQPVIFYDDPQMVLKSLGYIQRKRRSKFAVTTFKNPKFGLQLILYHFNEKQQISEQNKKSKIQIIQTGVYPFSNNFLFKEFQQIMSEYVKQPLQNQLLHQFMTLKDMTPVQAYS